MAADFIFVRLQDKIPESFRILADGYQVCLGSIRNPLQILNNFYFFRVNLILIKQMLVVEAEGIDLFIDKFMKFSILKFT